MVVACVDRRQGTGARMSEQALRQFFGFTDPDQASSAGRVAADHGGGSVAAAADIMGNDRGFENRPAVDVIWIVNHRKAPFI